MYTGIIIFMLCNEGSKSEGLFPFLYQGAGQLLPLRKKDDNPFEHGSFRPFDGKKVQIFGEMSEDLTLTVTQIQENLLPTELVEDSYESKHEK